MPPQDDQDNAPLSRFQVFIIAALVFALVLTMLGAVLLILAGYGVGVTGG